MRLVMIVWLDSFGCSSQWQDLEEPVSAPIKSTVCKSVGWLCIDFEEAATLGLPVKSISEAHDRLLTTAIARLDKDSNYHGFAPIDKKPQTEAVSGKPDDPLPRPSRRVNGRNNAGSDERIKSAHPAH
jgi:hypothetical protein